MAKQYWIQFDIDMIKNLKNSHEEAMQITLEMMPEGVNWKHAKEIKKYFKEKLQIELKTTKIKEIEQYIDRYDHDQLERDVIYGLTAYLKMKYTISNYLSHILKNNDYGVVQLRCIDGTICMQNKQPLSYSDEIKRCILHTNVPKGD